MNPHSSPPVKSVDDLALFGGPIRFQDFLHVGRPNIGSRERFIDRVHDIFDRRWLTNNGPLVQKFEEEIAALTGVKHVVAVANATVGLEIAVKGLGLTGEVIIPSFTFVATAHILSWLGLTPVFCDVDPATHNIDPARVEERITPQTSAILGVHLWGRPCDTEKLAAIGRKHDLVVLYDAAHALACSHQGRMIGGYGAAEVFSFHATKFFNTFEGGAITTDDDALAERFRLMRNFGFAGYDQVVSEGTNGKMSEIAAAMGLTNLESLPAFVAANRNNYETYRRELSGVPGVCLASFEPAEKNNYQYIVIEVDEGTYGLSRDALLTVLHAERVLARRYFYPGCHKMEPYLSSQPDASSHLPATEALSERVISLPSGTAVGESEIRMICELVRFCGQNSAGIRSRMQTVPESETT